MNVDGTRNALEAAKAAGVRRFVHCGTEAAILAGEPVVNGDETLPLRPDSPAPYPSTKAKAEQLVRDASTADFEAVVLRPRFVWGVGDTTLLPAIADAARQGKFAWIAGGDHLTSTTHVDNVVEGLLLAAEKGRAGRGLLRPRRRERRVPRVHLGDASTPRTSNRRSARSRARSGRRSLTPASSCGASFRSRASRRSPSSRSGSRPRSAPSTTRRPARSSATSP